MTTLKGVPFLCFIFTAAIIFHLSWQKYCLTCGLPQIQVQAFAQAFADPSVFINDPMIATRFEFLSVYPKLLGILIPVFQSLDLSVFVIHIISIFFLFFFFYKIALLSFKSERIALLCVCMLPFQYPMFYGYSSHWRTLFFRPGHNIIGLAFGICALYFYLKKRKIFASFILGFGCLFHSLSILHLFLLLFISEMVSFISNYFREPRWDIVRLKENSSWIIAFLIVSGPFLFLDALNYRTYSAEDIQTFINVSGYDSFPFLWSFETYLNYFSFLSLLYCCWIWGKEQRKIDGLQWAAPLILSSLFLCLIGIIGVQFFKSGTIIVLQLTRSTVWVSALSCLFITYTIVHRWKENFSSKFAAVLIVLAIAYQGWFHNFITPFFSIAVLLFIWKPQLNKREKLFFLSQLFLVIAWAINSFRSFSVLNFNLENWFYLKNSPYFFIFPALFCLIWVFLYFDFVNQIFNRFRTFVSILVFLISFFSLCLLFRYREAFLNPLHRDWQEVQLWSASHSTPEMKFITPLWLNGFRTHSKRSPVVEWQDGSLLYFSPSYGSKYRERLKDLGLDPLKSFHDNFKSSSTDEYHALSKSDLRRIHNKYAAEFYIVVKLTPDLMPTQISLDLPLVFENNYFKVFSLKLFDAAQN